MVVDVSETAKYIFSLSFDNLQGICNSEDIILGKVYMLLYSFYTFI